MRYVALVKPDKLGYSAVSVAREGAPGQESNSLSLAKHVRPAPGILKLQRVGLADQNPADPARATNCGTSGLAGSTWVCLTHDG